MKEKESIEALNMLIEINNNIIEGYETALQETKHQDLKSLFFRLVQTSERCKKELEYTVQNLGGIPSESTNTPGKFFRVWADVKAAVRINDRKTLFNSCEYVKDVAIDAYNKTFSSTLDYLSLGHQSMLIKHVMLINVDHDKVKDLRDSLVEYPPYSYRGKTQYNPC